MKDKIYGIMSFLMSCSPNGKIVFANNNLARLIETKLIGCNLNTIFPQNMSEELLQKCNSNQVYAGSVTLNNDLFNIHARKDEEEIAIYFSLVKSNKPEHDFCNAAMRISKSIASSLAVILPLQNSLKNNDVPLSVLASMEKHLMNINRLSKNIVDYSSFFSGDFFVNFHEYDVGIFLSELVENIKSLTISMNFSINLRLPKNTIYACFDKEKITRAILNIVSNSIASREDGLIINFALFGGLSDSFSISISDNGSGCPSEVLDSVKHSFFSPVNSSVGSSNGAGFGLSLTNAFLEMHNGSLVIISNENQGTVVTMNIPKNLDKAPPMLSSIVDEYSGGYSSVKLELSQVLPISSFE